MNRFAIRAFTALALAALVTGPAYGAAPTSASGLKAFGQHFRKANGQPRRAVIFLFPGMTTQDFVGIYSVLNFASGDDLKIELVATKKGLVRDERGRLAVLAEKSIDEVDSADIFIVPGGLPFGVMKDAKTLRWVKKMYDSSEYTASICTGAIILAKAGAIDGKRAGTAWVARGALAPLGVEYVPTPPPAVEGKYYSAAGAAAGIEIGLKLVEEITRSREVAEVVEFAAEWNPHSVYGAGDPRTAHPRVLENFAEWIKTDPLFRDFK